MNERNFKRTTVLRSNPSKIDKIYWVVSASNSVCCSVYLIIGLFEWMPDTLHLVMFMGCYGTKHSPILRTNPSPLQIDTVSSLFQPALPSPFQTSTNDCRFPLIRIGCSITISFKMVSPRSTTSLS